jgi:Arc/MetJ family transcription regulator
MRTRIQIDAALLAKARKLSDQSTMRGVVEEGLRLLIRVRRQEQFRQALGKYRWEGDLSTSRRGRGTT